MRCLLLIAFIIVPAINYAMEFRASAPTHYVVKSGDTLWDIASKYLEHPWQWSSLRHSNPNLKDPNRLYPGDVLQLKKRAGVSYLRVIANRTIKLSPLMRPVPLDNPIPTISYSDIKPFLNSSLVLDGNELASAPYVLAFNDEHLLGATGDEVYVNKLCPSLPPQGSTYSYALYRQAGSYHDPMTKKFLGYKANLVAYGEYIKGCNPATLMLTDITQAVEINDRIMPNNHPDFDLYFQPKSPSVVVNGVIIDILGDYTQGAAGLIAVINKGKKDLLHIGDVVAIYSSVCSSSDSHCRLPVKRIGEAMIFRVFSHASYALVLRSVRSIHLMDKVGNP
ncbi:MAG: LysM peptidoglycan-binding domain-containing protein [Legionella sp.]